MWCFGDLTRSEDGMLKQQPFRMLSVLTSGSWLTAERVRLYSIAFLIVPSLTYLAMEGPYRIVRHPLYICEGIAVVGAMLQVISPWAILIAIVVAMLQYRRMINEEAILNSAFPEYSAYAERTPLVIPARLVDFCARSNPVLKNR